MQDEHLAHYCFLHFTVTKRQKWHAGNSVPLQSESADPVTALVDVFTTRTWLMSSNIPVDPMSTTWVHSQVDLRCSLPMKTLCSVSCTGKGRVSKLTKNSRKQYLYRKRAWTNQWTNLNRSLSWVNLKREYVSFKRPFSFLQWRTDVEKLLISNQNSCCSKRYVAIMRQTVMLNSFQCKQKKKHWHGTTSKKNLKNLDMGRETCYGESCALEWWEEASPSLKIDKSSLDKKIIRGIRMNACFSWSTDTFLNRIIWQYDWKKKLLYSG